MARSRGARLLLLATALAAFPVAVIVPGLEVGVLFLAPAIVLLASLLTGRYVGEDRLRRLAAGFRPHRRRGLRAAAAPRPARPRALMPRGGCLVGTSLAVRPPPHLAAVRR
jgi:hypothetical protein